MKFTSNAALKNVLSTLNIESITFWLTVDQDFEWFEDNILSTTEKKTCKKFNSLLIIIH